MSGFTLDTKGFDEVLKKLDVNKLREEISYELKAFGEDVVQDAKQLVHVDEGFLKNSINSVSTDLEVTIVVNCEYAAYVEFGTRRFAAAYVATLPSDWQTYAAQFKGKGGGGSFDEFVQAIMAWVLRKGIGAFKTKSGNTSKSSDSLDAMQQAAYWIALNIIQNGIKPHPYLYPAFEKNRPKLLERLRNLLK